MSKLINLISGPGGGKTTMAVLIFAEMKILGYNVEYVPEYAKQLVWMQDFDTLNNQYHVSNRQFKLFDSMKNAVDFIITDGSLLHGLYYNRTNQNNVSNIEKTEKFILDCYKKFNNINIILDRRDNPYKQEGRIQSFNEALTIDRALIELLRENDIKFFNFIAKKENVENIIRFIIDDSSKTD